MLDLVTVFGPRGALHIVRSDPSKTDRRAMHVDIDIDIVADAGGLTVDQ